MPNKRPTILLAAGGTGGHLFPAEALAQALSARGVRVELVSDARVERFSDKFPAAAVHHVSAGTVMGSSLRSKIAGLVALLRGVWQCFDLLARVKPDIVVGFGGYPTVPPVLAASFKGIKTLLHEQNAVMGRANRFLARRATMIATGLPLRDVRYAAKTVYTGNPVRARVLEAAQTPYRPIEATGQVRLLIFGGSQGARVMSDVVPPAIGALGPNLLTRLSIVQQAREEDFPRVQGFYERLGVKAEVKDFFKDMPERIAQAHLVIGRSGASTVAELAVIGRPSILVPLPGALDQDQAANAQVLADAGGATVMVQSGFTPASLSRQLTALFSDPALLAEQAGRARAAGIADAAERLADLVLTIVENAGAPASG